MNRKILVTALIVGALGFAAVAGVFVYRSANASAALRNPVAQALPFRGAQAYDQGRDAFLGDGLKGARDEYLAQALGITVEELQAAYDKATEAAIDQALAEGLITQAQADDLKSSDRVLPFGGRWMGWLQEKGIDYQALLADALGISVEKLEAARLEAVQLGLEQAVADGKLTQEQADLIYARRALFSNADFQSAMKSAFEAAVKQAVTNGVITQTQADLILKNQSGFGMPGMDRPDGMLGGFGRRGGRGGMFPGGPFPAQPPTDAP